MANQHQPEVESAASVGWARKRLSRNSECNEDQLCGVWSWNEAVTRVCASVRELIAKVEWRCHNCMYTMLMVVEINLNGN